MPSEETKKRIISEKDVPPFIKNKIDKMTKKDSDGDGCCLAIVLVLIALLVGFVYVIWQIIAYLGILNCIIIAGVIILVISFIFGDDKYQLKMIILAILAAIGLIFYGVLYGFGYLWNNFHEEEKPSVQIEESYSNETNKNSTDDKTQSDKNQKQDMKSLQNKNINTNADISKTTESRNHIPYNYEYTSLTDEDAGFSFIYPTISENFRKERTSAYSLTIKDMEMNIGFSSQSGGIDRLKEQFRLGKLDKDVLSANLFDNGYTMTALIRGTTVYTSKFYYGNSTHQGIIITYPKDYLDDEHYQNTVSKIVNGFVPSNPIP